MQLATIGPASDGARAQLLFALLIFALLPIVLMAIPRPSHGLVFDFGPLPEQLTPATTPDHAGWIRAHVRSTAYGQRFTDSEIIVPARGPAGPRHRLDLLPTGELRFDSRPIDLHGLRSQLDLLMTRTSGWVDFHPDPDARYEDVVATLAPVAYSGFDRLRLDNSPYAADFEAATAAAEVFANAYSRRVARGDSHPRGRRSNRRPEG